MATAMLNVRLDTDLKREGDRVLSRQGVSATEAIRGLYRFMEETRDIPDFCKAETDSMPSENRRKNIRKLVGVARLKPGEDLSTLKAERLARMEF